MAITFYTIEGSASWADVYDDNINALDSIEVRDMDDTDFNYLTITDGVLLQWEDTSSKWVDVDPWVGYSTTTTTTTSTTTTTTTAAPETFAWDPSKTSSSIDLSRQNRRATCNTATTTASTISEWDKSSGKWYWEIYVVDHTSYYQSYGICDQDTGTNFNSSSRSGLNESWAIMDQASNLREYHDGAYTAMTESPIANGDILMYALDLDNNRYYFGVNGTWLDSGDPVAGTGYIREDATIDNVIAACLSPRWSGDIFDCRFNSGEQTYSPPSGYSAVGTGEISTTTTTTV